MLSDSIVNIVKSKRKRQNSDDTKLHILLQNLIVRDNFGEKC